MVNFTKSKPYSTIDDLTANENSQASYIHARRFSAADSRFPSRSFSRETIFIARDTMHQIDNTRPLSAQTDPTFPQKYEREA